MVWRFMHTQLRWGTFKPDTRLDTPFKSLLLDLTHPMFNTLLLLFIHLIKPALTQLKCTQDNKLLF